VSTHIPSKKSWTLTPDAFDKLLRLLNPDRERAAEKYESIRHRLITFFESRGCSSPEDYTDETINRVARRVSEGIEIYTSEPSPYFYGVAHHVLQEYWDNAAKGYTPLDEVTSAKYLSQGPDETNESEARQLKLEQEIECLGRCLLELRPQDRELIIKYYQGETSIKVKNRKLLAERLDIPLNALRIRALRIREKLEGCLERYLNRVPGK
jgi:RNA polymerase sigma factor (sigma-70 family)